MKPSAAAAIIIAAAALVCALRGCGCAFLHHEGAASYDSVDN
jgi:hypothetical protein